jgi:DNA-binding MarR family transcriptional regulator
MGPHLDSGSDELNNRIFCRLFQLGNLLQRQAVRQLGITTIQWAVLGALSEAKFQSGVPVGDLAEYLVVGRQNLGWVLKRLERDSLLERVAGEGDRRARIVRLTADGRQFWADLLEQIDAFCDQAAASLAAAERIALARYLYDLQADLNAVKLPGVKD